MLWAPSFPYGCGVQEEKNKITNIRTYGYELHFVTALKILKTVQTSLHFCFMIRELFLVHNFSMIVSELPFIELFIK